MRGNEGVHEAVRWRGESKGIQHCQIGSIDDPIPTKMFRFFHAELWFFFRLSIYTVNFAMSKIAFSFFVRSQNVHNIFRIFSNEIHKISTHTHTHHHIIRNYTIEMMKLSFVVHVGIDRARNAAKVFFVCVCVCEYVHARLPISQ